ncbi:hypothetical protein KIL84_011106 [Mauremys mutica]|uniref:Uncharacterized protein n=1 Tax=Mauremys mutica TaxID=74926 RepID=A0A9D4B1N4_9SAUR|nr:hypothetical protein KIL84_011106 [Mauremys mutica]
MNRKKLLYWLVGVQSCDMPEFKETILQCLPPTLKVALGIIAYNNISLKDLETREAYEIQREAFPTQWFQKKVVEVTEIGGKQWFNKGKEFSKGSSSGNYQQ